MKYLVTLALVLNIGAASLHAQPRQVKMTYSGSTVATLLDLAPGTVTDEEDLAGNGSLGPFTFHKLRTDGVAPQPSDACSGQAMLNLPVVSGAGVFRFQDGSLLTVSITEGALCIDFNVFRARLTETYQVTGGTGRFKNAAASCGAAPGACALQSSGTVVPVLADSQGQVKFLTNSGEIEGNLSGLALGE